MHSAVHCYHKVAVNPTFYLISTLSCNMGINKVVNCKKFVVMLEDVLLNIITLFNYII